MNVHTDSINSANTVDSNAINGSNNSARNAGAGRRAFAAGRTALVASCMVLLAGTAVAGPASARMINRPPVMVAAPTHATPVTKSSLAEQGYKPTAGGGMVKGGDTYDCSDPSNCVHIDS